MLKLNRLQFIRKACLTSGCFCGFASLAYGFRSSKDVTINQSSQDPNIQLLKNWIAAALQYWDDTTEQKEIRQFLKESSSIHYHHLGMDEVLNEYVGSIDGFISMLENNWAWKVRHDEVAKVITADENKSHCVCPLLDQDHEGYSVMCYCSEGFAERMFTKIMDRKVRATVLSSVRRGDKTCKYQIIYN